MDKLERLAAAATESSREMAMELSDRIGVKALVAIWEQHQRDVQAWSKEVNKVHADRIEALTADNERLQARVDELEGALRDAYEVAERHEGHCGLDQNGEPYISEDAHLFGAGVAYEIKQEIAAILSRAALKETGDD